MATKLIEKCKRCHGTGYFYHAQAGGILLPCPRCEGYKVVEVKVDLPIQSNLTENPHG